MILVLIIIVNVINLRFSYSEFCSLIIESLHNACINLKNLFENCIRVICENLEKHVDVNRSIERKHVERAIEVLFLFYRI